MRAFVIPVEGPVERIDLPSGDEWLDAAQKVVGGLLQSVDIPAGMRCEAHNAVTGYVNEEGEWLCRGEVNRLAMDILAPIYRFQPVLGPLLICGIDRWQGRHLHLEALPVWIRTVAADAGRLPAEVA